MLKKWFVLLEETVWQTTNFRSHSKAPNSTVYKEKYFRYIHPEFIKCIADQNNELIAFCSITMPSFTKALKKANGKIVSLWIYIFIEGTLF